MDKNQLKPCEVNVSSETGRLRAVLLHRPGVEIERMTPLNANAALYSDILNKPIVDQEYHNFSGVLERWTQVYYVQDILEELLKDEAVKTKLLADSLKGCNQKTARVIDEIAGNDPKKLAQVLIEGCEDPKWDGVSEHRYLLKPLYNLFFTRDASSTVYNRVLINSMSFEVRERESLIYEAIFKHFFGVDTLNAMAWNPYARTEGGDVQIASPDMLCIGQGIRTNRKGIEYLAQTFAREREHFTIVAQELPKEPESFIHLDMVFTFLSKHQCMAFEPMLTKKGLFAGKDTTVITIDHGKISYKSAPNIVDALNSLGWEIEPVIGGGSDPWTQLREQWHSGEKFVAAFPGSELPRAGGGARCMTMPILRD